KLKIKGAQHASCKTRDQTPRQTQKDTGPRQWLLPDKIEAVPVGERGRGARAEVRLRRTPPKKASVPFAVDRAHGRRRQAERHELQPVHPWIEDGRRGARPQDPG